MSKAKLSEQIWEKSSGWVDQIGEVIGKMAKQLGVASEHVYEVYTKQVFFEGLVHASVSAFFILMVIGAFITLLITSRDWSDNFDRTMTRIVCFGVSMLFIAFIAYNGLLPNLLKVFNPEYYTIKEIMSMLESVVK